MVAKLCNDGRIHYSYSKEWGLLIPALIAYLTDNKMDPIVGHKGSANNNTLLAAILDTYTRLVIGYK